MVCFLGGIAIHQPEAGILDRGQFHSALRAMCSSITEGIDPPCDKLKRSTSAKKDISVTLSDEVLHWLSEKQPGHRLALEIETIVNAASTLLDICNISVKGSEQSCRLELVRCILSEETLRSVIRAVTQLVSAVDCIASEISVKIINLYSISDE